MVARQGARRRWHFAHKPPYERCADSDKALHNTAMAMIIRGFSDALDRQSEYRLGCLCKECGRTVSQNVAVPGAKVETERSIVAGTRSDLVLGRPGRGPVVIEVVVTHDLEPEAHGSYTESGIPVLKVRPTWDTLAELEFAVITEDTLNVPPVQCTACKNADELRRREAEKIQGRVDSMLKRMNQRQQAAPAKPRFRPWTHDKFGRPMFPNIREKVYTNAIILAELGFVQAERKPWLFFSQLPGGVVFANFGSTEEVAIWENPAALIHWKLDRYSVELESTVVEGVLARCRAAGAEVRVSFYDRRLDQQEDVARTSPTNSVDRTVLNVLLAEAARSFPEVERRILRDREAAKEAKHANALREQVAQAEAKRQRQEAADSRSRAEQEQWAQLNDWIKERSSNG